jgi:hypothetical protein
MPFLPLLALQAAFYLKSGNHRMRAVPGVHEKEKVVDEFAPFAVLGEGSNRETPPRTAA